MTSNMSFEERVQEDAERERFNEWWDDGINEPYEDLIPVLGITEVAEQRKLAQAAIASECRIAADQLQEQAELQAQLAKIDAFFASGFVTGEDIWWYGPVSPVKAVYLADLEGKAGIAVLMHSGPWLPRVVDFKKISARFDE